MEKIFLKTPCIKKFLNSKQKKKNKQSFCPLWNNFKKVLEIFGGKFLILKWEISWFFADFCLNFFF